jgi:hypothetical protein
MCFLGKPFLPAENQLFALAGQGILKTKSFNLLKRRRDRKPFFFKN